MIRWIIAILGYSFFRFPGAILGYLLGSFIENFRGNTPKNPIFTTQSSTISPSDFELNLLSLASLVIKADGKVTQSELDFVRSYFVQSYGRERANATFRIFNQEIKKQQISATRICSYLRYRMRYESRLQMVHFLFSIAKADGHVSTSEVHQIQKISSLLGLHSGDFESIKAMFFNNPDSAYKILEIEQSASVVEIKKAYRTMVKKYHPDKLQHMDEAYRKGAEEKFKKVQEAYEQLQKEKGF